MASSDRGTKRTDPDTGKKFYDLNMDPIVSPYTGKSYPRSFFEQLTGKASPVTARKVDDEDELEEEDEVEETAGPEIVSLEDADAEEAGEEEIPKSRMSRSTRNSATTRKTCSSKTRTMRTTASASTSAKTKTADFIRVLAPGEAFARCLKKVSFRHLHGDGSSNRFRLASDGHRLPNLPEWGHSSAGRALAWHARGQRFDPAWLHQILLTSRHFVSAL